MSGLRRLSKKSKRFLIVQKMHQLVRTHDRNIFFLQDPRDLRAVCEDDLDLLVRLKETIAYLPCAYPYTVAQDSSVIPTVVKTGVRSHLPM